MARTKKEAEDTKTEEEKAAEERGTTPADERDPLDAATVTTPYAMTQAQLEARREKAEKVVGDPEYADDVPRGPQTSLSADQRPAREDLVFEHEDPAFLPVNTTPAHTPPAPGDAAKGGDPNFEAQSQGWTAQHRLVTTEKANEIRHARTSADGEVVDDPFVRKNDSKYQGDDTDNSSKNKSKK